MILFLESIFLCILFFAFIMGSLIRAKEKWLHDYPPKVQVRLRQMGLLNPEDEIVSKRVITKKIVAIVVFVMLLTGIMYYVNHARTFLQGFGYTYCLWMVVNVFDATILDCLIFANWKKIRVSGTENMDKEYHDYRFYLAGGVKGCIIGLPAALLVGLFITVLT